MILVTAHMWPGGNAGAAYELMNATITNNGGGSSTAAGDSYFAHVLARPAPHIGCEGYEADVEVRDHKRERGLAPLLISVLAAAHDSGDAMSAPPSRTLARLVLKDIDAFNEQLKGRR